MVFFSAQALLSPKSPGFYQDAASCTRKQSQTDRTSCDRVNAAVCKQRIALRLLNTFREEKVRR